MFSSVIFVIFQLVVTISKQNKNLTTISENQANFSYYIIYTRLV